MHREKITVLFVVLLSLFTGPAYCGETPLFPASEFKLGYEGMYMYYDEPDVMHEKGAMLGGFGSWTGYFTKHLLMVNVEAEGVAGPLRYEGGYSDGTALKCDTDDYFVSACATFGMGFEFGGIGVTPYMGIAGRYWYDKIKATGGYERRIKQYYLPVGVKIISRKGDKWSMGGTLEGDLLLDGQVKSKLSQVGSDYGDAKNDQEFMKGFGGRVSVFMEYDCGTYALGMEPYFRYWQFDDSEKDLILYDGSNHNVIEPENKFYMSGIRMYVTF